MAGNKRRHDERRAAGVCINQPLAGPAHGPVHRGGRCAVCWDKKEATEKRAHAEGRRGRRRSIPIALDGAERGA